MKNVNKKVYLETSGARMVVNAGLALGLYAVGAIAYEAGKKVVATAALLGMGGILIWQVVDGIIVQKNQK